MKMPSIRKAMSALAAVFKRQLSSEENSKVEVPLSDNGRPKVWVPGKGGAEGQYIDDPMYLSDGSRKQYFKDRSRGL